MSFGCYLQGFQVIGIALVAICKGFKVIVIVWISLGCYMQGFQVIAMALVAVLYDVIWCFVCSAMKLDNTWASLAGIGTIGFPDPDPIHVYTVSAMLKCYHAIQNDYATILNDRIAHNVFAGSV